MPYAVSNLVNVLLFTVKTVVVENRDQAIIFLIIGRKEALSLGFLEYLIDAKFGRKMSLVHEEASSSEVNSCWRTKENMRYAHQQQQTSDCDFCSHSMNIASMNFCCCASGCRVLQAMAAVVSLSRLSHSTQGAFSTSRLSHHPLLFQRCSQICQDIGSISAIWISPVMDLQVKHLWGLTPVASASLEKVQMFPNMEKLSMRIGCSGSRARTFGVSAFISASAAEISFEHASSLKDIKVVTPICERPAVHITCLEDLLQWVRKAQQLAASVEQHFYDTDGGPDSSDLLRELDWLLDDSLAACCQKGRDSDICAKRWKACSWRDVKACLPAWSLSNESQDSTSSDTHGEATKEMGDLGQDFGAFSTLLRERYTDPVSELAADAACCCDSLRDSLADMAADTKAFSEIKDANTLTQIMDSSQEEEFPEMVEAVSQLNNQTTSAHVLLRISIEELENQWVQRVKERRPFQYIVGCAHWRDLVLSVQEGVLIPRPETEQMIDLAEAAIMGNPSLAVGLWADLGTGSGAIAIALARLLPSPGSVLAVDMSETAVAVARRNVGHYALTDKVNVVHGSWFLSLEDQKGSLAGVISNPPYIPSANIAALQAEVGKHEPRTALDGGQDGMKDLRQICHGSALALRAGGFLALETNGGTQAEAVADLLRNMNSPVTCFQNIKIVPDFAGICRFVTAIHC